MEKGGCKTYSEQLLRSFKTRVATGFLILNTVISGVPAKAQESPSTAAESAANQDSSNAAMLKELEQMRTRIQELEAQLKARSSTPGDNGAGKTGPVGSENFVTSTQTPQGPAQQSARNKPERPAPFSYADWTWLTGNPRTKTLPFDSKFFTPEIRSDVSYIYDFANPIDDTIGGSSEVFRSSEFQVTQLGVGGDFHYDNVHARIMTQLGMYSQTQPRNDASNSRGQWLTLTPGVVDNGYRYISEAYGGYHIDALNGINIDAGIFLSYIGLYSFYNFDNWSYQPSFVSSNTPWFFNGMRVQIFPNDKLKIEPWLINGWQSYGRFNHRPGVGGQILWRPRPWVSVVANQYALGRDTLGVPNRSRFHTDDSIQVKYYENPERFIDRAAFSLTIDAGCESGGGVNCFGNSATGVKQSFLGFMQYNRFWLHKDLFGVTIGGGAINNPGRYLVLLPPINGATAITGTPYFTENPGDPFKGWDASLTFDYMPSQYITFRWEYNHRASNVPYYTGTGGITPNGGNGNSGPPGSFVPGFAPDLAKHENRMNMAIMVKF
jgi:Putative beta-barrel porin-2, OmpL-like. bbp2